MLSSSTTANARLQPDGDPIEHAHALIASGRPTDAADFLRERIAAGRGGLLARLALVEALSAGGDLQGALDAAREANALNPNIAQAVLALGEVLLALDHLPAAIAEFQRALRLNPDSAEARFKLGCAWSKAGEPDKALEQFVLVRAGLISGLDEKIAAAEAMRMRPRSDAGYVRHLFDQFSGDYDARMRGQLAYRAPEILRELARLVMPHAQDLVLLDLGCGTGLSGEAFADMAAAIDGVDLSPVMIERAKSRRLYRELVVADVEEYLHRPGALYDLVIAADTLVYLGDLAATFSGVAQRLNPEGMFLVTLEKSGVAGFALGPKRRWRHSESYVRETARAAELDVAGLLDCSPRNEAGAPVEGLAVALMKAR